MNKISFKGKDIFVGIDVHKKSWDVKILTAQYLANKPLFNPPICAIRELNKALFAGLKKKCLIP